MVVNIYALSLRNPNHNHEPNIMKSIITSLLCLALLSPLMAAEKKSTTTKKPAAEEKKPAADSKPSAKAEEEAKSLTSAQKTKLMKVINEGDDKEVNGLPGIGETRAAAIKKARPVADVLDLLKIDGIGEGTFSGLISWAKGETPAPAAKKDDAAASKSKSKSTKKKS